MNHVTPVTLTADPRPAGGGVRPARAPDAGAIARIWHGGWRDAHLGHVRSDLVAHRTRPDFDALARSRIAGTTVAVAGGAIAGFVTVVGSEIEQLYVEAGWRGTGVAGRLLAHGEGVVAERFPVAWLAVVPGNSRARRFYERQGWHDTGPFDNPAETRQGILLVACRRYEKHVARAVSA
jgi:GNAT superfamily N-acetyltransferase